MIITLITVRPSRAITGYRAPEAEDFILTRLNQWRLALGLTPFSRNQQLDEIARQQANYMSRFAPFSDARFNQEGVFSVWHQDVIGRDILDRLKFSGWPANNRGAYIGSEIAAYYTSVSDAIGFWQNSQVHSRTTLTPGFREAGVTTLCWRGWLLTYVVFASQPQTLTATYDPYLNALFLGDESRSYLEPNTGFRPDFLQITDEFGNRIHEEEWLLWDDVIRLPVKPPGRFNVFATDGVTSLTLDVDINRDRTFPSQPTPTMTPTATPSPLPTAGPSPTRFVPTATLVPSPTPPPRNGDSYDMMIYYNVDYYAIVNESGQRVNLSPLTITSGGFPFFQRNFSYLAFPYIQNGGSIESFPIGGCVQGFSGERFDGPGSNPDTCTVQAAWRSALEPGERFWLRRSFEINYGLEIIASCPGLVIRQGTGVCGFDLPPLAFGGE